MGGYGTWRLAAAQPHRFAAIAAFNRFTFSESLLKYAFLKISGYSEGKLPTIVEKAVASLQTTVAMSELAFGRKGVAEQAG
jgi:hypothetical protein